MDLSESIVPRSDQLNAEDVLSAPRTVTVSDVKAGSAEQPVDIHLVEFPGRPFKPSKTVRRVLVAAWGPDSSVYAGRRMTLYRDPAVRFGGDAVGGIRVSHLSHITKPLTLALTVTRGKRATHVIQPLKEEAPAKVDPSRAIGAFAGIGVTEAQLTDRLGREASHWTAQDLTVLHELFGAIKSGRTSVEAEFAAASSAPPAPVLDPSDPDYDPTVDPNSGYEPPAEQS